MDYSEKMQDFIDSLSGEYVTDLNRITEKIEELSKEERLSEANELLNYANEMMESRQASEDDFRSLGMDSGQDQETLKGIEEFYHRLEASMSAILEEKYNIAKDILIDIPSIVPFIQEGIEELDKGAILHSFQSLTDEIMYRIKNPQDTAPVLGPELQMYLSFYGALLLEQKDYNEAEKYYGLALKSNPIDGVSLLSMSRIKRMQKDLEKAREYNHRVFNHAYQASHFAEAFANEGYFLYKEGKADLALAFNMMAMEYEEGNPTAEGNLVLLKNKYPQAQLADKKVYKAYMEESKIKGQPDEETLSVLRMLGEQAEEDGNFELALQMYVNLEQFVQDPKIHDKIHELIPKFEEEQGSFMHDLGHNPHTHNHHNHAHDDVHHNHDHHHHNHDHHHGHN